MSPETPEGDPLDQSDRRRSVRAKRDKPDYYDALDYDSKRQKTPKQGQKKRFILQQNAPKSGKKT